jgi:hypothetical protein
MVNNFIKSERYTELKQDLLKRRIFIVREIIEKQRKIKLKERF